MKRFKVISIVSFLFLAVSLFSQQFNLNPNKSPEETRSIRLKIVADQGYRERIPHWKEEITGLIDIASPAFFNQVGIQLQITGFGNWERETRGYQDAGILFKELEGSFPRTRKADFDIVIGLTPDLESGGGYAKIPSGYIIIPCMGYKILNNRRIHYWLSPFSRKQIFPSVILHEIGHIFGCGQLYETGFVMSGEGYSMIFCEKNIETIKKYKWREFPLMPQSRIRIQSQSKHEN